MSFKNFPTSFALAGLMSALFLGCASTSHSSLGKASKPTVVEAGCGQCQFGLKEKKGCDLAVRSNGQSYFVDGFTMRQFGNPDADGGMCNTIKKAKVTGQVVNGRFAASRFELLPESAK